MELDELPYMILGVTFGDTHVRVGYTVTEEEQQRIADERYLIFNPMTASSEIQTVLRQLEDTACELVNLLEVARRDPPQSVRSRAG